MIRLRRKTNAVHVRRRDLFKYPDFRRAIGGQVLSQCGDALASLTLAQIMLFTFTDAPSITALTTALIISAVPLILVGPLAGHLADRIERRNLLCRGNALRGILTLFGLFALNSETHWVGYVVFGLLVALTRILYTARATALAQLVRRHELVAADSTSLILSVIAGAIGAGIGSTVSTNVPAIGLCIAALAHITASLLFRRISLSLGGGRTTTHRVSLRDVAMQLVASKTRFAMSATALHRMMFGVCIASIALLVDRSYHLQTTGYVTVLGFSAAGSFIGSTTAEWLSERYPRRSITVMAFALAGIAILTAALVEHPRLGLFAIAICALAFQNLRIRSDATIQANSSKANLGRLFAAYDVMYNISFVVGCMSGILASAYFSYGQVLGMVATGYASCAVIFLKVNDGKRQDESLSHPSARLRLDNRLVGV